MANKRIRIGAYNLKDLKDLLFTGQRDAISTRTFEAMIQVLEDLDRKCSWLEVENEKLKAKLSHKEMLEAHNEIVTIPDPFQQ